MKIFRVLQNLLYPDVQESIDNMPVGICCYWPGGLVKLKNRTMESLSFALFDASLTDGAQFWAQLQGNGHGNVRGQGQADGNGDKQWVYIQRGEAPVVRFPEGQVYCFQHHTLYLEGHALYEILALDQSAQYDRQRELEEKREQVGAMVERLRTLNGEIAHLIREREILATKTRLHDDLSRVLLSGRQYLAQPHPYAGSREALTALWQQSLEILPHTLPDSWRNGLDYAQETARALGMTLSLDGPLPTGHHDTALLASAIVTCLSNALRHAGADTVHVALCQTDTATQARISNNGSPPEGPIAERGGLADLRRQIERVGGTMEIGTTPYFELFISIPRGVEAYRL